MIKSAITDMLEEAAADVGVVEHLRIHLRLQVGEEAGGERVDLLDVAEDGGETRRCEHLWPPPRLLYITLQQIA